MPHYILVTGLNSFPLNSHHDDEPMLANHVVVLSTPLNAKVAALHILATCNRISAESSLATDHERETVKNAVMDWLKNINRKGQVLVLPNSPDYPAQYMLTVIPKPEHVQILKLERTTAADITTLPIEVKKANDRLKKDAKANVGKTVKKGRAMIPKPKKDCPDTF